MLRLIFSLFLLLAVLPAMTFAEPVNVGKNDKCPVCGMFVSKYPDFMAQVVFQDGSYAVFDGVKDMFKYYFDLSKYTKNKTLDDIAHIYVTDYYSMTPIDGQAAWYVLGSDVFGPMGKELIPFVSEADAQEFKKDHKGQNIFNFSDVTLEILKGLD